MATSAKESFTSRPCKPTVYKPDVTVFQFSTYQNKLEMTCLGGEIHKDSTTAS